MLKLLAARLIGIKKVREVNHRGLSTEGEPNEHYIIVRVPGWLPREGVETVMRQVEADAKLAGKSCKITVGHRLLRVDLFDV